LGFKRRKRKSGVSKKKQKKTKCLLRRKTLQTGGRKGTEFVPMIEKGLGKERDERD